MNDIQLLNNDSQLISAMELAKKLGIEGHYTRWSNRNIVKNSDFVENVDYFKEIIKNEKGKNTTDYKLTIRTAKKLCFTIESPFRNKIFDYFELCEARAKEKNISIQTMTPRQIAELIIKQENEKDELKERIQQITFDATSKITRKGISSKINSIIREVAQDNQVNYVKVWRRLYRQFFNNNRRFWKDEALNSKNHWQYIVDKASIKDLELFLQYAISYQDETAKGIFQC